MSAAEPSAGRAVEPTCPAPPDARGCADERELPSVRRDISGWRSPSESAGRERQRLFVSVASDNRTMWTGSCSLGFSVRASHSPSGDQDSDGTEAPVRGRRIGAATSSQPSFLAAEGRDGVDRRSGIELAHERDLPAVGRPDGAPVGELALRQPQGPAARADRLDVDVPVVTVEVPSRSTRPSRRPGTSEPRTWSRRRPSKGRCARGPPVSRSRSSTPEVPRPGGNGDDAHAASTAAVERTSRPGARRGGSSSPGPERVSRARPRSCADWNRSRGSFSRQRLTTRSRPGGTPAVSISDGSLRRTAAIVSTGVVPAKARRPESIS